MSCQYCGAPIERSTETSVTCSFCGRVNDPLPARVEVPVPVQVVQNVVQVIGPAAAEAREVRCPQCRKRLFTASVKDAELNACAGCGGIWVRNASARRVLSNPEPIFAEMATRAGDNAQNRATHAEDRVCPECPAVLDKVRSHGIELDVCEEHGTWFDAFELSTLVRILRGEQQPAAATRTIRCATCHTEILADRANITDFGLQCDACWRGEQASEISAFDQKIQREGGALAVGGIVLGLAAAMLGSSR
ncbi:MAG TPA: zf-TFIIB domain-containing protein [Polyangiaceae bacterium]|jgi:Zn-finger nucleic acid-binding protein